MATVSNVGAEPSDTGSAAIDRETRRVDDLHSGTDKKDHKQPSGQKQQTDSGFQVEQDTRIEQARTEAASRGGGSDQPEEGLNQDG